MNWEAMGALAEMIGATGVIFSLIYLATQIRQNTKATRSSMTHSITAAGREWAQPILNDAELARTWALGSEDPWQLSEAERYRFFLIAFSFFKTYEDMHYQFVKERFDPEIWRGWEALWGIYAKSSGLQVYWQARSRAFSAEFRAYIEAFKPPDMPRIGQITQDDAASP